LSQTVIKFNLSIADVHNGYQLFLCVRFKIHLICVYIGILTFCKNSPAKNGGAVFANLISLKVNYETVFFGKNIILVKCKAGIKNRAKTSREKNILMKAPCWER